MEKREHEEQVALSTPALDAILADIPPIQLDQAQEAQLKVAVGARNRLRTKLAGGTLTQADIENELSNLPDIGGIETEKESIVKWLIVNIPSHNVKDLPEL